MLGAERGLLPAAAATRQVAQLNQPSPMLQGATSTTATAAAAMASNISELYENQRFYGITWCAGESTARSSAAPVAILLPAGALQQC